MKKTTIILLLVILTGRIFAQQTATKTVPAEKKKYVLFYEKTYLHTDRNYYSSGDDIWFKAYLVNAINNTPMETSACLYVELISSDAKIVDRKIVHLDKGFGNGDFQLKDSIPGGTYKIRAYTNWMRNFDDNFVFEKEIKIYNTLGFNNAKAKTESAKPEIQFFPESGSLINDVINTVAFKALDENGKGCIAEGSIVNSKNDTVGWFKTSYLGMGTFALLPVSGENYWAVGKFSEKIPFKVQIPAALDKGYGLQVIDFDTTSFFVSVVTNQTTLNENSNKLLVLSAMSHGKNYFAGQFAMNSLKKDIRIPKKDFPKGVSSITLYDTLLHPQCQRLFFIAKNGGLNVSITPSKTIYEPREKVTVKFKVTDKNGASVKANLSFAALDALQTNDDMSNILSYLYLESEVKGNIENAAAYFDPSNPQRYKQLDLLLLTQGWRDYLWRRVKESAKPIGFMVEPGLTISGRVRQKFKDTPIPGTSVTLYAPKAKNGCIYSVPTQSNGNYFFDGIEFYGEQSVTVSVVNAKGNNAGWVLLNKPDSFRYPIKPFPKEDNFILAQSKIAEESQTRKNTLKKYTLADTIRLDEVTVTARKAKEEKQNLDHEKNGGIVDYALTITPDDYNLSIGQYMALHIPKAEIDNSSSSDDIGSAATDRIKIRYQGDLVAPRFNLDNWNLKKGDLIDESLIYNLYIEDVDRILVSTTDVMEAGSGYVISVYTKPNRVDRTKFYTLTQKYEGFYEARTFYSPEYPNQNKISSKPDLRPTLFWAPTIETDANGEGVINFYNSDKSTDVKYSLQGVSDSGSPAVGSGTYKVK
jgi:hypothetical protein